MEFEIVEELRVLWIARGPFDPSISQQNIRNYTSVMFLVDVGGHSFYVRMSDQYKSRRRRPIRTDLALVRGQKWPFFDIGNCNRPVGNIVYVVYI